MPISLLDDALKSHGGIERWRTYKSQSSTLLTGGGLWALKGMPLKDVPRVVTTELHQQRTSMTSFGEAGWTMTWTPEHVAIKNSKGETVAERDNPRRSFAGHRFTAVWDPLHLAYFNGYAMWTYHALPFILAEPGYEVFEIDPVVQDGATLRGLSAQFPENVESHTREQRFYFGSDNLLRRHDYEVDVWAGSPAVHLLSDYIDVAGFRFPTRRAAFVRNPDGTPNYNFRAVTIEMSNYILK